MKSSLVTLLIGAIFAMTYALPDDGDDKVAKMAKLRFFPAVRVLVDAADRLINSQQEVAMKEDDDDDGDDDLLSQALLDRIQEKVTSQDDEDDDDDKAKAQFHLHFHVGK